MTDLVFALQFKGSASPAGEGRLRAKTTAASQTLRTEVGGAGVRAGVEAIRGETASFESEVQITGEGTFVESGTITYGSAGSVRFKTVGQGVLGPSGIEGLQRGAVIWELASGEGTLRGATGLITSNFTVGSQGEVVDNQFAVFFLP